ncbi:twin-arginine translocase subunit TatC [Halogeometricum limi]|uniref:Sec-independent protein translocase protein TatC n=1 Tax=Halogeometricum limi TaxID=555875 RepID=A0A1I6FU87_9EURY|nr:twin-arginine translocase subunit TatC [Halogeometricum limi]SFR33512.1 sec-independent protein translocase protein TatC [Halogeometricum limi]
MADDSESDRSSPDADESDGSTADHETPESSATPTDEPDAASADTERDDAGVSDAAEETESTDADDDSDPAERADAPDIAATSDGRPGADVDPDDVETVGDDSSESTDGEDDSSEDTAAAELEPETETEDDAEAANLEREGLIPPPDEETIAEATASTDDADTDDGDGEESADDDDRRADFVPSDYDPPETKTPEEMGLTADDEETIADTDGGAPAVATGTREDFMEESGEFDDDGILGDGPETDQEMPLADHIEEMVHRLAVVFAIGGLITLVLYPGADLANSALNLNLVSSTDVINFLWDKHIPGAPEMAERRPRIYGPLELVLTELKVAGLAGLVIGLPVFVYETYLFMRPGLFPKERRYYLAAVPTSLVLAFIGIAFAHFIVLPAIFAYFTSYTTGTAVIAFGLKETFNLILILMGYNAIIFQIPLFIMLAIMMNLVTREWLVARRLLFWASFLGLAFFVSPDPTGMAPIIIAATMITLFEGTLFLLRWTGN